MRNIDKIKGLENQLEELQRQKTKLRGEIEMQKEGLEELKSAHEAFVCTVVLAYGEKGENGTCRLKVPHVDVAKTLGGYRLTAELSDDGVMTITATPEEKAEKEGADGAVGK